MSVGLSFNSEDMSKWFGVSESGGGYRAQAPEENEADPTKKKLLAAIDFNATGNGNPAGFVNASLFNQV